MEEWLDELLERNPGESLVNFLKLLFLEIILKEFPEGISGGIPAKPLDYFLLDSRVESLIEHVGELLEQFLQ